MALHKSTDGGATWTTNKITSNPGFGYALAIDVNNDNIIYVGGKYQSSGSYVGGLFKTLDGGTSWIQINQGISGVINAIAIDPISPNKLYVGTKYGVYKSENSGLSWTQSSFFQVEFLKINPTFSDEIFAVGYYGVYYSSDSGSTWEILDEDFILDRIASFDMEFTNSILYGGTSSGSIYRNRLAEFYLLALSAGPGGTTNPTPVGYVLDLDTNVSIESTANEDWAFNHWSGDVPLGEESNNSITITINSDKSIRANFIQLRCKLTIESFEGGTTNPNPGTFKYDTGTAVTIQAISDTDYDFTRWSGDVPPQQEYDNPLILIMDTDKSISAIFSPIYEEDGNGCFVATAAYGSPCHFYVRILRDFRDTYLINSKLGRKVVNLYYKHSPPLAGIIAKHKVLRDSVRSNLLPLVVLSYSMLQLGPTFTVIILSSIMTLLIFSIHLSKRRVKKIR